MVQPIGSCLSNKLAGFLCAISGCVATRARAAVDLDQFVFDAKTVLAGSHAPNCILRQAGPYSLGPDLL